MKKIKSSIIVIIITLGSFFGCSDFMELPPVSTFNIDSVFVKYTNVEKLVYSMYYNCVPLNFDARPFGADGTRMGGGSFASAITDEGQSFHIQAGYQVQQYYIGNVDATESASWTSSRKGEDDYLVKWSTIRKAYILIENVDKTPDATLAQKERIKAEAKLMIATVYFEMFKRYGGVPIITKAFKGTEPESEIKLGRSTVEQTYNFISSLINDVITNYGPYLPTNYNAVPNEFGRLSMAMAYGLKARLECYAASPLYNTATPYSTALGENSNLLCFMNEDQERWKKASDAATKAIDFCLANQYMLVDDATKRDDGMNYSVANMNYPTQGNTEVIWGNPLPLPAKNNWDNFLWVRGFAGTAGYACNLVPVNQVERYELDLDTPGQFRDWNAGFTIATGISPTETDANKAKLQLAVAAREPYKGLDPRFKASVIYNGDENLAHWSTTGEVDMANAVADPVGDAEPKLISDYHGQLSEGRQNTTILHYVRKFHRGYEAKPSNKRILHIYMRMAELYLIRAEALNEYAIASGSGAVPAQVHSDLNKIRERSGMCPVKADATPLEMRDIIAHERNIEMYYEDQRWFDLRRTLKSEEKIPVMVYKVEIRKWYKKAADKWPYKITYRKVEYQKRYWSNHWYMNPFPKSEVNKFYGLIQNPGW